MNKEDKELGEDKLKMIKLELKEGIDSVARFNPSVTIYGSARLPKEDESYKKANELAFRLAKELGYNILSGGGPGIMEAANKGGYEAGVKSVGLTIRLPHEQGANPYVTDEIPFNYFFTRQASLSYSTEACIFCPGGFGTMSELFEILTLKKTRKIDNMPVILFGSHFWSGLDNYIKENLSDKYQTIDDEDTKLYIIEDDIDKIVSIVKESKIRDGSQSLK
ncbi:MAG TPA: TIGR00730 family Rossman fold protein [Candidatus Paceibacterota bacterium]|jgi:hypothetical protein|nr:TIGR00730 family Rossman fold protein [Candidatus Paceibacterota bacterium]HPI82318.1 TIGR00730 family Rossman fold protein [Candidatus Paceibacterota bacterium]HPR84235.1 TIGR00730 family Rossman fold protein [Candidatus Paceibacterota bacterium]